MATATNPPAASSPLQRFRGSPSASVRPAPAPIASPPKFIRDQLAVSPIEKAISYAQSMWEKISKAIPPTLAIPHELLSDTADMDDAWRAGNLDAFSDATRAYTMRIWHWFAETPEGKEFQRQRNGGRS